MSDCLILYCTVPDELEAERIAAGLVEEGLAACVNLLPGMRACYRWDDALQFDRQTVLLAKTTVALAESATAHIVAAHSDDVPCVLRLPITGGHPAFLTWIGEQTGG